MKSLPHFYTFSLLNDIIQEENLCMWYKYIIVKDIRKFQRLPYEAARHEALVKFISKTLCCMSPRTALQLHRVNEVVTKLRHWVLLLLSSYSAEYLVISRLIVSKISLAALSITKWQG